MQYPDFHFINEASYQILLKITIEGDIEYTISNSEFNNNNNRLKHKKKSEKSKVKIDKKQILDSLLCLKKNFMHYL